MEATLTEKASIKSTSLLDNTVGYTKHTADFTQWAAVLQQGSDIDLFGA